MTTNNDLNVGLDDARKAQREAAYWRVYWWLLHTSHQINPVYIDQYRAACVAEEVAYEALATALHEAFMKEQGQ